MPEAAPAAAPAPAQQSAAPNAAAAKPGAAPTAPPPATEQVEAWGEVDDRDFARLAKKAGWKVKANGKEQPITSAADLLKEFEFSAKGRGAAKAVEEARKEAETVKAERAEAQRLKQLHEAARKGDYAARVELGLVQPTEQAEREAALAELPPEVRALWEEREAMRVELEQMRQQSEQTEKQTRAQREAAVKAEFRQQAVGYLQKVFDAAHLDLTADATEARPFLAATYQAMREFSEHGLDLSQDTTAEMVVRRAQELRSEASEKSYSKIKPTRRLELVRPVLEQMAAETFGEFDATGKQVKPGSMDPTAIVNALTPKLALAIARAVALHQRNAKTQGQRPAVPAAEKPPEPPRPEPIRFGSPFLRGGR